ncbi:MAG: hypothetical protein IPN26_09275 [Bacteroidetes bacterium]|nr:hypothetical protein [Bacteroidota bacterium]
MNASEVSVNGGGKAYGFTKNLLIDWPIRFGLKPLKDQNFAIQHYGLLPNRTFVVPYGIEARQLPDPLACEQARESVRAEFGLSTHTQILFFNGTLDYSPNLEALKHILLIFIPS